jgi:hypothetical protein
VRKRDELLDPKSCLRRGGDNELIFVMLSRDRAAPHAIHTWANERVRLGLNTDKDAQIIEARALADQMHLEGKRYAE